MTFSEKLRKNASAGDLFPELSSCDKTYNYIIANIAVQIREKRKEMRMNQKQFADALGVTQGMISKWESGDYNFTIEKLVELYDKLNMEIDIHEKRRSVTFELFPRTKIPFSPWECETKGISLKNELAKEA